MQQKEHRDTVSVGIKLTAAIMQVSQCATSSINKFI